MKTKVPCSRLLPSAIGSLMVATAGQHFAQPATASYAELRRGFTEPDHATWGEVPLWWWEGAPMSRERVTWQLETLAAKGVKAVCPIQRSPGRCDPQSFDPEWWEMLQFTHQECRRLGMKLWAYDQLGYGHYGWLEKAAASVQDTNTLRVQFEQQDIQGGKRVAMPLPASECIAARAYPLERGSADDTNSVDLQAFVREDKLEWDAPGGAWRIAVSVAVKTPSFYLSGRATEQFIDMLYGELERTMGKDAMGQSFAGVFQDEHPPTPRDVFTHRLAESFQKRNGYPIGRAIPALHFDVGPMTPKYRIDFFDCYLEEVERTYWKKVYDWTRDRSILTSHDNWGRNSLLNQTEGYIDYFRSQRWFSVPGYDDAGQRPIEKRNYYDTKIAASIARLYQRPRVWNEAFHSSGWGRSTDQTLSWLTAGMAFGANLYNEHGLYYSANASTWEHAAPDPHWRQPYWAFYQTLSDWVARSSYLMSQSTHVVDAAVHYPVVDVLAGKHPGEKPLERKQEQARANHYMRISRSLYDAGIDNDIFDDDSCLKAKVGNGCIQMGGNKYRALVFGPYQTVRRRVIEKARDLVEAGGTVVFTGTLPSHSPEGGREDPELKAVLAEMLGTLPVDPSKIVQRNSGSGGFCAFLPGADEPTLPSLVTHHIDRDFLADQTGVFVSHRRIGTTHVYLLQNILDRPLPLNARLRVDGAPEIWDAFTGRIQPVEEFTRKGGYTRVKHTLKGNTAHLLVVRTDSPERQGNSSTKGPATFKPVSNDWAFSVEATRDNRWGEFRWPPSETKIGPEVREFRYLDAGSKAEPEAAWMRHDFAANSWQNTLYSSGPHWLVAKVGNDMPAAADQTLATLDELRNGLATNVDGRELHWKPVEFSKRIGLAKASPWGGHSGYPDGHIDRQFIQLPEGRKLLFTRIHSPAAQRLGLRIELNNHPPRLWVNGTEQPVEDAVGNLPLRKGINTVLLELPDGTNGRLYVQSTPPSVETLSQAAQDRPQPDLNKADWIWSGNMEACYVRKEFSLPEKPRYARLTLTAFSGFRLFVNGVKIEEEIGPWSNWKQPESFAVTEHLQPGNNVIAIWGQHFKGIHVNKGENAEKLRGIVLALRGIQADGSDFELVTDGSWKGSMEDAEGWTKTDFHDASWGDVDVKGHMGDEPWGLEVTRNTPSPSTPKRPLSIHLESPYLTCFNEEPELIYDIKSPQCGRMGYYRFKAPPGLRRMDLGIAARAWVNGEEVPVRDGVATVPVPPPGVSQVLLQVEMRPGAYGGAAFAEPISLGLQGGNIQPGRWADYALPTYSGIGNYDQTISFTREELDQRAILDLGDVRVAAEVLVNGRSAGVRLAAPFEFDLSPHLKEGPNQLRLRVANTIAPHYQTIPALHQGPIESGLIGPVRLRME